MFPECPIHVIKPPADPALAQGWDNFIAYLVERGIARKIDMTKALSVSNEDLDRFVDTSKPVVFHSPCQD